MDVFADYKTTIDTFLGKGAYERAYGPHPANTILHRSQTSGYWELNRFFARKVFKAKGCSYTVVCENGQTVCQYSHSRPVFKNYHRTNPRLVNGKLSRKHRVTVFHITISIPCEDGTSTHVIRSFDIPPSDYSEYCPFSKDSVIKLVGAVAEEIIEHDVLPNRWFTDNGFAAKTLLEARRISERFIHRSGRDNSGDAENFYDRPAYYSHLTWRRKDGKNQNESFSFERRRRHVPLTCRSSTRIKGVHWCIEHHGNYRNGQGQITAKESRQLSKLYRPLVVGSHVYMISGSQTDFARHTRGWDVDVLRYLIEHRIEFTRYKGEICVLSPEMATLIRVSKSWDIATHVVGKREKSQ